MTEIYQIDQNFNKKNLKKGIKKKQKKTNLISLAKSLNIGYYIISPIFLGILTGLFLDRFFKTNNFYLDLFFFIGIIGSFYNLFRLTKENIS
jgi:F0F1-type ATP synthase assembly protein I